MSDITVPFPWQLAGGFLALITIILALYIFVLNPRRQANRLVSLATTLLGIISIGVIVSIRSNSAADGLPALLILAAAVPASGPALLLATLGLLKPQLIKGRMSWLWLDLLSTGAAFWRSVLPRAPILPWDTGSIICQGLCRAATRNISLPLPCPV